MLDLMDGQLDDPMDRIVKSRGVPIQGIAICGSHPATVETAPFHDPSWIIFACSPHNIQMRRLPRWDIWSEVHAVAADKTRPYDYLRGLEQQAKEKQDRGEHPLIWMRDKDAIPHFPGAQLYPEEEMKAKFCPFLFSSSIAFMQAKAIDDCERYAIKQIGLWGVLQASDQEYAYQRSGTQYFIWEATKRGIKVLAARESNLFELPPERW
jgi:hypothetical protein